MCFKVFALGAITIISCFKLVCSGEFTDLGMPLTQVTAPSKQCPRAHDIDRCGLRSHRRARGTSQTNLRHRRTIYLSKVHTQIHGVRGPPTGSLRGKPGCGGQISGLLRSKPVCRTILRVSLRSKRACGSFLGRSPVSFQDSRDGAVVEARDSFCGTAVLIPAAGVRACRAVP